MAYHTWGEEDFDWDGLDEAVRFVDKNLVRWGRINVRQSKEKFGTLRCYCSLGYVWGLYGLLKPRAIFFRWGERWKWTAYWRGWDFLGKLLGPWQRFVYRQVYKRAVAKFPHLTEEILCAADYWELLHGLGHEYKWVKLESKREE